MEVGGLDTAECFVELDNTYIIDIPYFLSKDIETKELNKNAVSLFADLSDFPVYHVKKNKKTKDGSITNYQLQKQTIFNKLSKVILGWNRRNKDYQPYKVDYRENPLKNINGRKIIDVLWYEENYEKGIFLLDNGFLITETTIAPHGTGLAGLNFYNSIKDLIKAKGNDYFRLTEKLGGDSK